jgi:hypothetical protein
MPSYSQDISKKDFEHHNALRGKIFFYRPLPKENPPLSKLYILGYVATIFKENEMYTGNFNHGTGSLFQPLSKK